MAIRAASRPPLVSALRIGQTVVVRSFGVEEEFLLVDARTGNHAPVAESLLGSPRQGSKVSATKPSAGSNPNTMSPSLRNSLTKEVQREQL